jgi:hypothetical protein
MKMEALQGFRLKHLLMVVAWLLLAVQLHAQTYTPNIPDSVILGFRNWIVHKHQPKAFWRPHIPLSPKINEWSVNNFFRKDTIALTKGPAWDAAMNEEYMFRAHPQLEKVLTGEDAKFMLSQWVKQRTHTWSHFAPPVRKADAPQGETAYLSLSLPLFSRDLNTVMVIEHIFEANLISSTSYQIYRRGKDSRWRLVTTPFGYDA